MVQHKSVRFHCPENKKAKPFQEPEGMTNVDLKALNSTEECSEDDKVPKAVGRQTLRKYVTKSMVICGFIIFGMLTLLLIVPEKDVYRALKSAWTNVLHSHNNTTSTSDLDLPNKVSAYIDKLSKCQTSSNFDDCCAILAEIHTDFVIEACTVEAVNSIIDKFNSLANNLTENMEDVLQGSSDFLEEVSFDFPEDSLEDQDFQANVEISKLMKPLIDNKDLHLESDDVAILVTNGRIISKAKPLRLWKRDIYQQYPKDIQSDYQEFQPNNAHLQENQNDETYKTKAEGQQPLQEDPKQRFKYIKSSDVKKKKSNDGDKEDLNPVMLKPNQCVPYNPNVRSQYQFLQQPTQLAYDSVSRNPGNPYAMTPQFGYPNTNYLPLLLPPSMTPQYPFNPIYMPQPMPSSIQASNPSGQYFICNPVPSPTSNHLTAMPGVEIRESTSLQDMVDNLNEDDTVSNKTRASDMCPSDQVSCGDELKCIKEHQLCDNEVNCKDASDELDCSCTDRIGRSRICDGFFDCPNGEDEIGCFGCNVDQFNCDDWTNDKDSTCLPMEERCDGTVQCPTGRDEDDCAALSQTFGKSLPLYKISNTAGFLYKNYKGKWYPACSNGDIWAASACEKESGINILSPSTRLLPVESEYPGSFISALPENDDGVVIVSSCVPGFAVHVQCPLPTCGKKSMTSNFYRSDELDDGSMEEMITNTRNKRSNMTLEELLGESRVVGGRPCKPASWPWVVSIYRNGIFHCGGTIITDEWIVSAAHCVDRYSKYYFEVEAGILRRFSYSPMQQTRFIYRVISHNAYDRANLKNDLALLKVSSPFKFNRYVRPICLPSERIAGGGYIKGPTAGTLCTAVGWGSTVEHGPDPDHLREVEVPVLSHCKHPEDEDGQEICAGLMEGGKDACQGDSGGPFMCRNPNSPNQWYLAGVVSHGEGCARPNEPGVYTRVSLYLPWIYDTIRSNIVPIRTPLHKCPGYQCKATNKCLPRKRRCDRLVDCLLGDDERQCEGGRTPNLFDQAMRHMVGSIFNSTEVNKLDGEERTTATPDTIEQTTLITMGDSEARDKIFSGTFKMENTPTERDMNTNESGYSVEDTSFATGPPMLDTGVSENYQGGSLDSSTPITVAFNSSFHEFFKCGVMLEIIESSKRCNGVIDCQDATDEMNCSCVQYLQHRHPNAICDGIDDCHDMSDEQNCGTCRPDEFYCRLSNTCIEGYKKCDRTVDCLHNEDEWDCFALTDGTTVLLDNDLRPHLNTKGVVSFYYDHSWTPVCSNWTDLEATAAGEVCLSLGMADYTKFKQVKIDEGPLEVIKQQQDRGTRDRVGRTCNALYVKCRNVTVLAAEGITSTTFANEPLLPTPWIVAIYSDGEFKCTGALLNLDWVLTSTNCFQGISNIQHHHVAVLSGADKGHLDVEGPHEQTRLVIQSTPVLFSDALLLKLEKSLQFTRYTRPVSLNFKATSLSRKEICVAVGRTMENRLEAIILQPVKNCTSGSKCFKRITPPQGDCNHKAKPWTGTIVCDVGNGLYPSAVYQEPHGSCGFRFKTSFSNVSLLKKSIKEIMAKEVIPTYPPPCQGLRCFLGQCITTENICDSVRNCREGSDEDEDLCSKRKDACGLTNNCVCSKSEVRCANGRCIPKRGFCDKVNDCGDESDEPMICSCFTYMNLTQPEKICDGIVNCQDKSDENPEYCKCSHGSFKCGQNSYCVPQEMVCDSEKDCPNGEDEEQCLKLRPITQNKNEGEVVTRTAGEWHSGCFKENLSTGELTELCEKLGFPKAHGSYMHSLYMRNKLADNPILNPFSVVWIHKNLKNKLRIAIRTGNDPIVSYKHSADCYRLYIKCN